MAAHDVSLYWHDAAWYHRLSLPGREVGTSPKGAAWDFRPPGRADAYMGGICFEGKRVLEVGPASGFWTAYMERHGARVLALEIDAEHSWDTVPGFVQPPGRDVGMWRLRNSWHQVKDMLGLRAEIVYGHAEQPPQDRGRFDILTLCAVLLHCRRPVDILERCAALSDEAVVIVERHFPELGAAPVMRFAPTAPDDWGTWWDFSPSWFERVLPLLGFRDVTVTYHQQTYGRHLLPMFTVVGRR